MGTAAAGADASPAQAGAKAMKATLSLIYAAPALGGQPQLLWQFPFVGTV
jgi:hypothetical protein